MWPLRSKIRQACDLLMSSLGSRLLTHRTTSAKTRIKYSVPSTMIGKISFISFQGHFAQRLLSQILFEIWLCKDNIWSTNHIAVPKVCGVRGHAVCAPRMSCTSINSIMQCQIWFVRPLHCIEHACRRLKLRKVLFSKTSRARSSAYIMDLRTSRARSDESIWRTVVKKQALS